MDTVPWNRVILEEFCSLAILTPLEEQILRTRDEYENLNDYLYEPYAAAGGNGSAKRVMEEVKKLPLHNN